MDIKRLLIGISIAVTLLWVLSIVYLGVRGGHTPVLEIANIALVPVTAWWGLLYTGFWVMRGSAVQTFIFGISALTVMGVFCFAFG